jgi:hypothetical protein
MKTEHKQAYLLFLNEAYMANLKYITTLLQPHRVKSK